jgi:hypothetical protein
MVENLSVDPYFTHYDPSNEHLQFSEALERLDKKHTKEMTKVQNISCEVAYTTRSV